jgi:hypothetical protein
MPDHAAILRLVFTLGAAVCCGAGPAAAQVTVPTHPGLPGKVTKFKVEALGFKCLDETGYDSPWWAPWISDEIRVGIDGPTGTTVSRVFDDVDTGEERSFGPTQSCILPIEGGAPFPPPPDGPDRQWQCDGLGMPGPLSFTVVMAEEDSGFFHDCLSTFPPGCNFENPVTVPDFNDDLIGHRTVSFTAEELVVAMPAVGDTFEETITLGPCVEPFVCPDRFFFEPEPAEYTFTWRLTRMPDFIPPIDPDP